MEQTPHTPASFSSEENMTKRSTTNSTSRRVKRGSGTNVLSGLHETILSGIDEANAVTKEVAESDTQDAFTTTLPSNDHNGTIA